MQNNYHYFLIKDSQLQEIGRVYAECFNSADIGEHWSEEAATEFLTYLYKIQPDMFYVATLDQKIVGGIAGIIKPWCDGKHIHEIELFVHPDHQKRGVASSLTRELLQTALEKYQITEFEGIADGNLHDFPLSWYKRLGAAPTGLIHIAGKPIEMLTKLVK